MRRYFEAEIGQDRDKLRRKCLVLRSLITSIRQWVFGASRFESCVRTAESRSIADLWVDLLVDHGIPARCTAQLSSGFMGDGMAHDILVREVDREEAKRILAAYWEDESESRTEDQ